MTEIYLGDYKRNQYNEIGLWLWTNLAIDWRYDKRNWLLTLDDTDVLAFNLRFGYAEDLPK